MVNFTSNTYQIKREILSFSNKISKNLPKPERKFIADMNCGILASRSCLLTDIVDQLHEPARKINIVDRLSRHLAKGTPKDALKSYLAQVKKWCPDHYKHLLHHPHGKCFLFRAKAHNKTSILSNFILHQPGGLHKLWDSPCFFYCHIIILT